MKWLTGREQRKVNESNIKLTWRDAIIDVVKGVVVLVGVPVMIVVVFVLGAFGLLGLDKKEVIK